MLRFQYVIPANPTIPGIRKTWSARPSPSKSIMRTETPFTLVDKLTPAPALDVISKEPTHTGTGVGINTFIGMFTLPPREPEIPNVKLVFHSREFAYCFALNPYGLTTVLCKAVLVTEPIKGMSSTGPRKNPVLSEPFVNLVKLFSTSVPQL